MYGQVLRTPHVRVLVAYSVIARVPLGITSIALVLFVKDQTGSFAWAGGITAIFAFSSALLSVWMSRLIDRHGQTFVLLGGMVVYCVSVCAIVVLGASGAPPATLIPCAILAGAQPPVSTCLRPLWTDLLASQRELLPTAYALDALLVESVFVVGPLLTGVLVALLNPQAALFVALGFIVVGIIGFASTEPSRRWRGAGRARGGLVGALRSPGLKTLTGAAVGVGTCFGALEVAFAAYGSSHELSWLAGALIALNAVGSAIGGLWYGANAHRIGPIDRAYLWLMCAFGPLVALVAAAPTLAFVVIMALLSGMATAPLATAQNLLVGDLAPRGRVTESFTWLVTALVVGIAIGNAAAGAITDLTSWRVAVLVAASLAAVAAVVTMLRRRTLVPVPAGQPG